MVGASRELPRWIRAPLPSKEYDSVRSLVRQSGLATVCREAHCPNLTECWSRGTATLMLLGETCTRRCRFCAVQTEERGGKVDWEEAGRVAQAVAASGLKYVVLTMVARDDLPDQGAALLAKTIREIRAQAPGVRVEMLASDLGGSEENLSTVLAARPEVFAHNLETVRRLTPEARDPRASYDRSLEVLTKSKRLPGGARVTKSSLMLGLGETRDEIEEALRDLRGAGVDIVTLGQYLRPGGEGFHDVLRYVPPAEFAELAALARELGFSGVASAPLVRSSYMAEELYAKALTRGSGSPQGPVQTI